jgi:hypothetical protein
MVVFEEACVLLSFPCIACLVAGLLLAAFPLVEQ